MGKIFGNGMFVFELEIEDIVYEKNFGSVLFYSSELGDYVVFMVEWGGMIGNIEVKIGSEIDFFICR